MSWLMATVYDRTIRASEQACLARWRQEIIGGIRGEVLEVGAGTGLNLPHYPNRVSRLVLTEPDPHMREQLRWGARSMGLGEPLVADASLDALPAPDASFDAVVATLVLCSVPDLYRALAEIHRVLRPSGRYAFIEHVAAENRPRRLVWQKRIEPLWKRIAGNCHLTRQTEAAIRAAGFDIEWIEHESIRKTMPLVRPSIRGIAVKPA